MKLTQHGPNLWQISRLIAFNCFLVREEDGLTLVDTNLRGSDDAILQAAQTVGLPIRRITLTHAHEDHAGSIDAVVGRVPGVAVALTARTADFLRGERDLLPGEPDAPLRGSFITQTTTVDHVLRPGDHVGSLRVVAAPGHTPDHVAFLDERDGTLLAGDAFQTQGRTAVSGVRVWLFPFPSAATWHPPTALASARALRALNPTRLAVGHGRVLNQPGAALDAAIRTAEARFHGAAQAS